MGMKRCVCLISVLSCFGEYAFPEGEPGRFAMSQVTYQAPALMAYVDVLDQNGEPPAKLAPSDFSARINQQNLRIASVTPFDKSGEGIAYIFLVDVSKSLQRPQFDEMRSEINHWVNGLTGNDQMAIFTFGDRDKEIVDFTSDKASLLAALQGLAPTDMQTKLYLALRHAIDLRARTDAKLPSRRAVVVLSDGKDEGSGFTADDVGRLIQQSPIPIYAIGFSRLPQPDRTTYLEALNRIAGLSGGLYIEGSSLEQAYAEIRQAIRRVFIVNIMCAGCQVGAPPQPLEVTLNTGTAARTDRLLVSVSVPQQSSEDPWWKQILDRFSWKIALAVVLSLSVAVVFVVIKVQKQKQPSPATVVTLRPPQKPPENPPPLIVTPPVVLPGRKIQLTVISGNEHGRGDIINLATKAVVGRDSQCAVAYPRDSEMSAKHFELILTGEHVEVQDLGSTNGTLLNGARLVAQQRLEDGDCVRAGRTEVRINFGA